VTVAAGIVCSDGLLICADSEVTAEPSKRQREKVHCFQNYLVVTGAGSGDFIKMAFDKLCDKYKSSRPVNVSDARQIAEDLVLKIHEQHIFAFYEPNDAERPGFDLVIGSRCRNGKLALVMTSDTTALLCDEYEAIGTGQDIFEYWAKLLYDADVSMDLMSYLTLFILREVKRNVTGCGGDSHVIWMPQDKKTKVVHRLFNEDKILADFPDSVVEILSKCRDLKVNDAWFESKVEKFVQAVRAIRMKEKQDVGFRKYLKEHPEFLRRPPGEQKSEDKE